MAGSAASSLVSTPCGAYLWFKLHLDLWFESRAEIKMLGTVWVLPLRPIIAPLQQKAWTRRLFCMLSA